MSTLVAQTISNGTVSTSSANVIQGSAKAWVNFNGITTATVRASYNVSSVTRNSTGDYTVNFTNAMPDTNYATIMYNNAGNFAVATNFDNQYVGGLGPVNTTNVTVSSYTGAVFADSFYFNVAIFR
jgi:hypothetical protein